MSITKEQQAISKIKELGAIIGTAGAIAGGAIRDLHLGRVPKDYDIFIYKWEDYMRFLSDLPSGFKFATRIKSDYRYNGLVFELADLEYKGEDIQLICWGCRPNPHAIIEGFEYTINMAAYSHQDGFVVTNQMYEAIVSQKLIFNPKHNMRFCECDTNQGRRKICLCLFERGYRLAKKLGFEFPQETIDAILSKYPYTSEELLEKDL